MQNCCLDVVFLSLRTILVDSDEECRDSGVSDSSLGGQKLEVIDLLTVQEIETSILY